MTRPIVVVGASVAGVRTAQALRGQGHEGPIVMVERETHLPYDKPPLTKAMLDVADPGTPVALVSAEELAALTIDLRLGTSATDLDVAGSTLRTDDGQVIAYSHLVIACGLQPRTLPDARRLTGVSTVRSVDDAVALRAAMDSAEHAVVVGAGFIGAEFAAAARARGIAVSIVEVQAEPMAQLLGAEVGAMLVKLHEANSVDVHAGVSVTRLIGDTAVEAVELSNGRTLPADVVVVGIGARPATDWLDSSAITPADGILCNAELRVVGTENVFAAGDVARWPHALYGQDVRIEHWTNANEHAGAVAAAILGQSAPAPQVPYVWSDQYGKRIQIVGRPGTGALAATSGDIVSGRFSAVYAGTDGVTVGALTIDDPRSMLKYRKAIGKRLPVHDVV